MTRNFFQKFEEHRVAYLLISGQATVLYEAAEFSENLDLWIDPVAANIERLLPALRASNARYYKLTPPLTKKNLRAGHGFHFTVDAETPFYLDILGQPPRVGSFDTALSRAERFETDWGTLPTVSLKDLVEIKKTQRLRDYSIIGALARRWIERPEFTGSPTEYQWILENLFSLADLEELAHEHPEAAEYWSDPESREFVLATAQARATSPALEEKIQTKVQNKVASLQRADREYWKKSSPNSVDSKRATN